nr:PREDICTED: uncharacterized protein LOC109032537 [Bemisia tabaci]
MMLKRSLILVLVLNCATKGLSHQDSYLREAKKTCARTAGASLSCLKYELLLFFHRILTTKQRNTQVDSLKLVSLPRRLQSDENFSLFASTPSAERRDKGGTATPSEWGKLVGFLDREASQFVATHGLQIPLPNWAANLPLLFFKVYQSPAHPSPRSGSDPDSGAEDPDRRGSTTGSYKKFYLLFPLIAVFKFLIIKLLLIPILIGVFAIKKMLVAAAMALPTLLQLFRCPRNPLVPGAPGAGGLPPLPAGNLVGLLPAAYQGYTATASAVAEPLVTDYSHYGYPARLHPPPHALYAHPHPHPHHAQWENLKNYKSHELD